MDDKQFKELMNKIDLITRLFALTLVKDMKVQKDQIIALSNYGLESSQIAEILGTTANTVNVALSRERKKVPGPAGN
jgi:DNA-binding CsgD family transcriptional regulator